MHNLLILDIETVPALPHFEDLSPEFQSLWVGKISKTVPENTEPAESYHQRAGILAEFGKVICISTAYYYKENETITLKVKSIYGDDEKEILKEFASLCLQFEHAWKEICFAGHNIKEFDIPFLCRRMIVNNVPLPHSMQLHDKKPWEVKMYDTLQQWKFGDYKNYISLDLLAHVLGVPTSKTDINGSMVQDVYYKDKDLKRIVEYCQRDVVATANIILKFKNQPLLNDENVVYL